MAKKSKTTKKTKTKKSAEPKRLEKGTKSDWFIILVPVIIIIILIAAVIGMKYFYKPQSKIQIIEYNGFIFVNQSGIWTTQIQPQGKLYDLMFKHSPNEVDDIYITYNLNWFSGLTAERKHIYITFDPEDNNLGYIALAAADLTRALTIVYGIKPVAACTKNITEACIKAPKVTCDSTTLPVIYITSNPKQSITYTGNCLIITGEKEELSKAVQRVLFDWYQIKSGNQ